MLKAVKLTFNHSFSKSFLESQKRKKMLNHEPKHQMTSKLTQWVCNYLTLTKWHRNTHLSLFKGSRFFFFHYECRKWLRRTGFSLGTHNRLPQNWPNTNFMQTKYSYTYENTIWNCYNIKMQSFYINATESKSQLSSFTLFLHFHQIIDS